MQQEILSTALRGKTATIRYPFQPAVRPQGLRGKMTHSIEKCTGCGLCARDCPASAITMIASTKTKTKKKPEFRLDRCIFCGTCEANCPTKAIEMTTEFELACFDLKTLVVVTADPPLAETTEKK
jgi:formate hydrogenlyase subunit 6/NADH:ubiquinone oxidoreductase subunit I